MFYLFIWRILFTNLPQYLIPWAHVGEATSAANDLKKSAELWTWLEEQVKDIWLFFISFEGCIYTAIFNLLFWED